jgi:centromeric protein E
MRREGWAGKLSSSGACAELQLAGKNGTVFAYGQTSAGKTHTLMGTAEQPGLMILSLSELFDMCESKDNWEFLIRISYLEIYNEEVRDLLSKDSSKALNIHDDPKTGPFVQGAVEKVVAGVDECLQILSEGAANRHFAATLMNANSSRSHTCFIAGARARARLCARVRACACSRARARCVYARSARMSLVLCSAREP